MKSNHLNTDAAIAEGIVLGGEFGPEHRPLVELCRRMEIALTEIAKGDRSKANRQLAEIAYNQCVMLAQGALESAE